MNHRTGLHHLVAGEEAKRRRTATVIAILPTGRALEMREYKEATMSTSNLVLAAAVLAVFFWLAIWCIGCDSTIKLTCTDKQGHVLQYENINGSASVPREIASRCE